MESSAMLATLSRPSLKLLRVGTSACMRGREGGKVLENVEWRTASM
jgi:hypothetical protein